MPERRAAARYRFAQGYPMRMLARDGSWQLPCTMIDVSDTGAQLRLDDAVDGLDFSDFVLKLAPYGTAQRPCRLVWHRGPFIGVRFTGRKAPAAMPAHCAARRD
jgi:hypothetical protein